MYSYNFFSEFLNQISNYPFKFANYEFIAKDTFFDCFAIVR